MPTRYPIIGDLNKPFHRCECECDDCEAWRAKHYSENLPMADETPLPAEQPTTWAIEEWRAVVGFEGLYEVSSEGRVRRVGRAYQSGNGRGGGARIWRVMIPQPHQGYHHVQLWEEGKPHTKLVHSLVAAAFLGPCPDGMEVNHKRGREKTNNAVGNLEYATPSQNIQHAWDTKLRVPVFRLNADERERAKELKRGGLGSRPIAKILGCHYKTVQAALRS